MNKNKYNFNRIFNMIKGFFPSVIFLFLAKEKDRIIFNSEFNLEFNQNSKYLFIYFITHIPDGDFKFVVNDSYLRYKLTKEYGNYFISSSSIRNICYILKAKTWITSSLETPVGGIFLNFGRTVIHLGHGAPIKKIGLNENYNNWMKELYYRVIRTNFSYFFSTSLIFDNAWAKCLCVDRKKVLRAAQSRNVTLGLNTLYFFGGAEVKHILYAPTWRPFSDTDIFPFSDLDILHLNHYLEDENAIIYLRLHPNFEEDISSDFLSDRIKLLKRSEVGDINEILGEFDVLITDYSSIYVDFLLTHKPVIFLPYDKIIYSELIGFSIDYDKYTPGPKPSSMIEFVNELHLLISEPDYYLDERIIVNSALNYICDNPVEQNFELIKKLIANK